MSHDARKSIIPLNERDVFILAHQYTAFKKKGKKNRGFPFLGRDNLKNHESHKKTPKGSGDAPSLGLIAAEPQRGSVSIVRGRY